MCLQNELYLISGTGFRSCPRHKHDGRKFINEGAFSAGGSCMPLYGQSCIAIGIRD
jgi:hypothetical protein